jgi:hypothetical protein
MSDYWDTLAARSNGFYASEDFESVAYRLISEQVLYHSDQRSRMAYTLAEQYEREMEKALSPFGIHLQVNRALRYVVAVPCHAKTTLATVSQTLFALVLRGIYEESARVGYLSEEGEVLCDLIELTEKYRLMSGRELPAKGEFDALMRTAKRWGIARRLDDVESGTSVLGADSQFGGIAIRPAIVDILGEAALQRLVSWQSAINGAAAADSTQEELEESGNEAA